MRLGVEETYHAHETDYQNVSATSRCLTTRRRNENLHTIYNSALVPRHTGSNSHNFKVSTYTRSRSSADRRLDMSHTLNLLPHLAPHLDVDAHVYSAIAYVELIAISALILGRHLQVELAWTRHASVRKPQDQTIQDRANFLEGPLFWAAVLTVQHMGISVAHFWCSRRSLVVTRSIEHFNCHKHNLRAGHSRRRCHQCET